ncbi:MAG: hypothetical protein U0528_15615 [Anaerolineae bacterium]
MPYYSAQSLILPTTTVRRERSLPANAISNGAAREGAGVAADDVVLRGLLPSDFIVLDALKPLGLRKAEDITEEMIQATPGATLLEGDPVIIRGKGRRARVLKAPATSVFVRMEGGDVVLQSNPEQVEVKAMYPGRITSVRGGGTSVLIETSGALIQGAWGNGKSAYSQLRLEPREGGIESLLGDTLVAEYRNAAVVMTRPILSETVFTVAAQHSLNALIAPSMHSNMRELALSQPYPVLLMEGFGELEMSEIVYNLLRDNEGRPATINAVEPARWSPDRPELLITLGTTVAAPVPVMDQPMTEGAFVRIARAPLRGRSGRVKRIVETPRLVENGLRFPGAEIELLNGQTVFVPLANLEMLGRPVERS